MIDIPDHGGNLAKARRQFPAAREPWLDLSTGISPHPYPFGPLPASAFTRLPDEARMRLLLETAAKAYGAPSSRNVLAAPGTQVLLPLAARLLAPGRAAILSPTYGEHRRAALLAGHSVQETGRLDAIRAGDYGIVVNPNNPDGRLIPRPTLQDIARELASRGGHLLVDEAFMDAAPADESLAGDVEDHDVLVLRSFGKFFGLAGVRLGFAIGPEAVVAALRAQLGPWAVSGTAMEIGIAALGDQGWQQSMRRRLASEAALLDAVLAGAGLEVAGGTPLFRFVRSPDAQALYHRLGAAGILVRKFDWDERALRIGLPGDPESLDRLKQALPRAGGRPK